MPKYLNEVNKNYRYDKIQQAIEECIHRLADEYMEKNNDARVSDFGTEYTPSEETLTDEAYEHACEQFLSKIDDVFGSQELYWIIDLMLSENFECTPHPRNPYTVRKTKPSIMAELTPFGLMFNTK